MKKSKNQTLIMPKNNATSGVWSFCGASNENREEHIPIPR